MDMSSPTERSRDAQMSEMATTLRAREADVLVRFLDRVRTDAGVPEADQLGETALRDDIPDLIDGIARGLEATPDDDSAATQGAAIRARAVEAHATHRLGRRYSLGSLLTEISHLRIAVLEVLAEDGRVDTAVLPVLHRVLDDAIIEAARSAHEQLTAEIRASETKYRRIVDSGIIGVAVANLEGGALRQANDAFLSTVGRDRSALDGGKLRWDALAPAEHASTFRAMEAEILATGVAPARNATQVRPDGSRVPIRLAGAMLPDDGVRSAVWLVEDVSTEVDALERAQIEVAVRERFAAVLSHDLRQPLQSVSLGASLLRRAAGLTAADRLIVDRMLRATSRMSAMIESVLDVSRIRSGQMSISPAPTRLRDVLSQVVEELETTRPGTAVDIAMARDDIVGIWDAGKIAQVFANLLGNAIEHGAETARIRLAVHDECDHVVISVENENRAGAIRPEVLSSLFEPFRRGPSKPEAGRGVGLGLYIACELVRAHGGSILVESDAERTAFRVSLPVGSGA